MNRQPDRNRLRALDGVEPPDQWDDIVLRAESDLPRLQLRPAPAAHRLLVAAVLLVLAGVAGALVMSTSTGGDEPEVVAADGGSTPAFPAGGGGGAPGNAPTTPDGLPVPTTVPGGSGESGSGSGSAGSSGSGSQGGGSSGSSGNGTRSTTTTTTTTTPATGGPTTTVVAPTTTVPTASSTTTPTETGAGGDVPADPRPSPVWGKRWQVLVMAQGGASRPMRTRRPLTIDARAEGELTLAVCNRIAASSASIDRDRLVVSLGESLGLVCGEPLDGHEAFLKAVLEDDPTFVVDGNRLVLTVGNRRVELTPL